jgi:aryl-alcohol dehydrogenase-like predicted oxidoreductase
MSFRMDNLKERLVYGSYRLPKDYSELSEMLVLCSQQGIKWIDTAPIYNGGLSEMWIGRWTKEQRENKLSVSTKAGKFQEGRNLVVRNSLDSILASIYESMQRLQQDRLDLLSIHDCEKGRSYEEILYMVKELVKTGLTEGLGLSNFPPEIVEKQDIRDRISCLQVSSSSQNLSDLIRRYSDLGIPVWIYRPFNKGEAVRNDGQSPKDSILRFIDDFPNCRFVFGASKLEQLKWIEEL